MKGPSYRDHVLRTALYVSYMLSVHAHHFVCVCVSVHRVLAGVSHMQLFMCCIYA